MKILRVIVDEVPDCCAACKLSLSFLTLRGKSYSCKLDASTEYMSGGFDRPVWCPLVAEGGAE
ncbi:MAG: hypothetical protein VB108_01260 [Anaerolineaceae bacterium]|nr:hypothetical protein [Anaerolineaceae bacterium]